MPDNAALITGKLIHIGKKNLAEWGITANAVEQIIAGIPGVPIRACSDIDPHKCDYAFDNRSHVGYGVKAWVDGEWLMASAAITDKNAVGKINDGTWTPFGEGSWSVAGIPTDKGTMFGTTGLVDGYQPTGIALVFAPSMPAFIGSGYAMVAAAVNNNHRGGNMTEGNKDGAGDGNAPETYTQAELDVKLAEVTGKLDEKIAVLETEKADAATAAEQIGIDAMIEAKKEFDSKLEAMTAEEKETYAAKLADMVPKTDVEAKLADMVPKTDVESMIAAAVTQGKADTLESIERDALTKEYGEMLAASVVVGAPFWTDGVPDATKISTRLAELTEMKVASITAIISNDKMIAAAASPGKSPFDSTKITGTPPGGDDQASKDTAALAELRELTGRM